ncbi:unnamed protein product [Adineta steineri]|uniref:Uncharacterized protein n=1 Tax=Adineta steineri TaxID=433720 RepID=A0A815GDN4_9BILA|nr:unnamed protein product [Adineta steineri]CAF1338319.1 unnamed protein product [Adineta steineri]
MLAVSSGSIGVDLLDIPNEPIRFMADSTQRNRFEDAIIAWTWKTFIDDPNNSYGLVLLPMTKACVRAMDVVQQFATRLNISVPETFVISGASKRGWTTWTTAAVDNVRVIGAIPIVMDMANFQENRSFPALRWNKTSNNTHGYIRAIVDFSVGPKPISAYGYRARTLNNQRRDFRLLIADPNHPGKAMANPVIWFNIAIVTEVETATTLVYSLTIENPASGWEGFFVQVNFPGPDGTILELTTETQIIPDTYPTADCHNEECFGNLV